MEERKKVIKLIRNRYILAISIIALMLILSQIIVQYNISSEEDKTSVINIAGRQRMLSQRINKTVLELYSSEDYKDKVNYLNEKLTQSIDLTMKDKKRNLIQLMTNLDMLSPLQTMLRGYSYVTIDDQIIKSTNDVDVKQVVNIHLSDGEVTAEIQEKMPKGE